MGHRPFLSSTFQYTFGPHAPTLVAKPGDALCVICPDSDNALSDGTLLTADQKQSPTTAPLFDGNPMAGPIHVTGAAAGDTLVVHIDAIELDRSYGQTGLAHGHGLLPPHLLLGNDARTSNNTVPRHLYRWTIDPVAKTATVANPLGAKPIVVPLNPFVGCIGVCPRWGQSISTLEKGSYGGNMDVPLTRPGSTVYLPVHCDGALLMMGDIHAAQGHGEIIGGGIETSGKICCTLDLIKGQSIPSPRFRDDRCLSATGVGGDLLTAIQQAYAHLLDWVVTDFAMDRWDAYNLISQVGSLVVGGLGGSPTIVAAQVPIEMVSK